jgi:hypothetical protein
LGQRPNQGHSPLDNFNLRRGKPAPHTRRQAEAELLTYFGGKAGLLRQVLNRPEILNGLAALTSGG